MLLIHCVLIELLSTTSTQSDVIQCESHRGIVNYFNPESRVMVIQCVLIELLSTTSTQSVVDPVCVPVYLLYCQLHVSARVMLIHFVSPYSYLQPTSTLCDVDPVCVSLTHFLTVGQLKRQYIYF